MYSQVSHKSSDSQIASLGKALDVVLSSNGPVDLCRQIVHAGFAKGLARGCALYYLDNRSLIKPISSYGQVIEIPENLSSWDESPLSEAVRQKTAVTGRVRSEGKEFCILAIAFASNGIPHGLIALVIDDPSFQVDFSEEFAAVISKLGAFYLESLDFGNISNGKVSGIANPEELTSRQLTILGHIEQGLVNLEIAKILMLSESTIRQETVRIYRALGVGNRQEAVKKAKSLGILPKKIAV